MLPNASPRTAPLSSADWSSDSTQTHPMIPVARAARNAALHQSRDTRTLPATQKSRLYRPVKLRMDEANSCSVSSVLNASRPGIV